MFINSEKEKQGAVACFDRVSDGRMNKKIIMKKIIDILKVLFDVLVGLFLVYMGIMLFKLYIVRFMKNNWLESFIELVVLCGLGILAVVFGTRRLFITIKSIFRN